MLRSFDIPSSFLNVEGEVHSARGIAGAACRVTFDSTLCGDTTVEQDVDDGVDLNEAQAWITYPESGAATR